MPEITLADDSLVDPAIAQVALTLWNEKDGRMCSAVQLLVRPLDVRGDEAGGHPGEEFVMLTITRDELRAMLDAVETDWRETRQATCQHKWQWHQIAGEGRICHACGLRDFSDD